MFSFTYGSEVPPKDAAFLRREIFPNVNPARLANPLICGASAGAGPVKCLAWFRTGASGKHLRREAKRSEEKRREARQGRRRRSEKVKGEQVGYNKGEQLDAVPKAEVGSGHGEEPFTSWFLSSCAIAFTI
jgi:hypothetical protein